ncbi:FAD-dependent oxidoreductase [Rhodobacteraceae bacterium CH30]|nr:FAD-dependent oxidoreductase [Rhodobacteraceae bacterium CH30]
MKKLLLTGGGHSHLFVLEALIRQPRPDVEITLLTRDVLAPYSGMLPGFVAGAYTREEIHIDLAPLCQAAGVRLIHDTATALDLAKRTLHTSKLALEFDLLSLDIGSSPKLNAVPGAADHACGVKPIDGFIRGLQQLDARPGPEQIVVAGAGAAGVELALALALRYPAKHITLISRSRLLKRHPARAAHLAKQALQAAGVSWREGEAINAVSAGMLQLASGLALPFDSLFWASGSSAQAWPQAAGLACDASGFVQVDAALRSTSHPCVFAGGDIASQTGHVHDKAGVYAVRHGAILAHNLLAALDSQPLLHYTPQSSYLSLLVSGSQCAIGVYKGFSFKGAWVWKLKNYIDRGFMRRFQR